MGYSAGGDLKGGQGGTSHAMSLGLLMQGSQARVRRSSGSRLSRGHSWRTGRQRSVVVGRESSSTTPSPGERDFRGTRFSQYGSLPFPICKGGRYITAVRGRSVCASILGHPWCRSLMRGTRSLQWASMWTKSLFFFSGEFRVLGSGRVVSPIAVKLRERFSCSIPRCEEMK
jgi:hypothetical protein